MRRSTRQFFLFTLLVVGVQCGGEPTGIGAGDRALIGRIASEVFEGDAFSVVTFDADGSAPDSLIIGAGRPRGAPQHRHETISVRLELNGPISLGTRTGKADVYHLVGGDVIVGSYAGTATVVVTAFTEPDSLLEGTLEFTADNSRPATAGRYGPTVSFSDGVFRVRVAPFAR